MKRMTKIYPSGSYGIIGDIDDAVHRLAAIEDILGDEYDLDLVQKLIQAYREGRYIILKEPEQAGISRLRELAQADREGRCVVFQPGYDMVSIYNPADEDGLYIMKVTGVITKEKYEAALRREQDGNRI